MAVGTKNFDEHQVRFEADFPFGRDVLALFRAANARPTWLKRISHGAPAHSWALHMRLPGHLEERFSISRQFLVYCAATTDLQVRDARRVEALIRDADDTVEPDFSILVSGDPKTREKLAEWGMEKALGGITLVPLSEEMLADLLQGEERDKALPTVIEKWISERNLYDERAPVTGARFHGRADILRDLDRHLAKGGGSVGIFGLRRIGKTSLMLQLADRLRLRPDVVPVFIDLEVGDTRHVAHRIGEELTKALADRGSLTERQARQALRLPEDWFDQDARVLIARVADSVRGLLTSGVLRDHRLIVMLDEAESLLPTPETPVEHAIDLFRALRGVSQETGRLNLVLAGVNATPTESPLLRGADNPLFGSLAVRYLGPLRPEECNEMIRKIGRRMQVRWDGRAVERLTEYVGAHPLLARLAASDLVSQFPERPLRPNLEHAERILDGFAERRSSVFEQMIDSLRRYYPNELEVLDVVAEGDQVFASELLEDDRTLVNHLSGYGVLDPERLSISIPAFRKWLRLRSAAGTGKDALRAS